MTIDLADWMLPVLYEGEPVQLQIHATAEQERAFLRRRASLFAARPLKHRFWGRDLDILHIERRLVGEGGSNILLLEGMGGMGKTTLLQHLGWWWQLTGLVSRVFVFEYDQKPWTRQQILYDIAKGFDIYMSPNELELQEAVTAKLRNERCLLILDNLESVTGEHLAIGKELDKKERSELHEFLRKLRGGQTLVLIGSRGLEPWLKDGVFESNVHSLRGLDPEARSSFGDEVLRTAGADVEKIHLQPEYRELLSLLAGHPLAMQVILTNLASKSAAEVLKALRAGDVNLDRGESRTDSILHCIDYSNSNLSSESRVLLECLAPFTGVFFLGALDGYIAQLRQQPELSSFAWERLPEVFAEAERWGIVRVESKAFLHLQPVFPYFLRSRADVTRKAAIDTAFRKHYTGLCGMIAQLQDSKKSEERQFGQHLARLEYENAVHALELALAARDSVWGIFVMLREFFETTKDNAAALALSESTMTALEQYPPESLAGHLGLDMVGVIDYAASRFLLVKRFSQAKAAYGRALAIHNANQSLSPEQRRQGSASIYHQLGMIAQHERKWVEAESHLSKALRIVIEFNDRSSQASTYHELGIVAQQQRQWPKAESHFHKALRIYVECNDRYEQAKTYHHLGTVAQEQRQWPEAESYYREALLIKIEFNDRHSQASTYHHLGIVAQHQRQWPIAESHFREALRIYVEFDDRYSQAGSYYQLGIVAQEQRQWPEAESHFRETLRIYVEFDDRHSQAGTYHLLGILAQEQRLWSEAESHFCEALRIYIEFNDRHSQASTYHHLGIIAEEQRLWPEAESHFREALRIYIEFNDRYSQASTYGQLGRLAQDQHQWPEAESNLIQALRIFVEFNDEHSAGVTLRILAQLEQHSPHLIPEIAQILGQSPEEIQTLLNTPKVQAHQDEPEEPSASSSI